MKQPTELFFRREKNLGEGDTGREGREKSIQESKSVEGTAKRKKVMNGRDHAKVRKTR